MSKKMTYLVHHLESGVSKKVIFALATLGVLSTVLHFVWSLYQCSLLEKRTRDAIAHTLEEPIRYHNWIAIKRSLQAFSITNEWKEICIKLSDGTILEEPSCINPDFKQYFLPLTGDYFWVSIKLSPIDLMTLAGIPILLICISIIFIISRYLRDLSKKVSQDIKNLTEELPEEGFFFLELFEANQKIQNGIKLKSEQIRLKTQAQAAVGAMAAQVAHDIRSPLAALNMIVHDLCFISIEKRSILEGAILQIKNIAKDLLGKKANSPSSKKQTTQLLLELLENLVMEKKTQYNLDKNNVEIILKTDSSSYGLFVTINSVELKRIISNIINNGIESLYHEPSMSDPGGFQKGKVEISLFGIETNAVITIKDNGKGIPSHVLKKLMLEEITYGKKNGSGLGLFGAGKVLESWGSHLKIDSEIGKGTCVSITFPRSSEPDWFVKSLQVRNKSKLIILDDDPSIHRLWEERLNDLKVKSYGVEVLHFFLPHELTSWKGKYEKDVDQVLYLCDYNFLGQKVNGIELIKKLKIADQSILITNRHDEAMVLEDCKKTGIKLIPKEYLNFLPISIKDDSKTEYDAILIDDNSLIQLLWTLSAKKHHKKLGVFSSPSDFYDQFNSHYESIPIYIDYCLGDGLSGQDVAKNLHSKGCKQIYLTTGYEPDYFEPMPWIQGIVGKEAIWG